MPTCPSCRSSVPEGKRFCADCGADLQITSAPTETTHRRMHKDAPRQTRFIPGTAQEVVAPGRLVELAVDTVLVMNPLYRDEIQAQLVELSSKASIELV